MFVFAINAGGIPTSDRFAPRYIVGNVPAGDPDVAQAGPFQYIPDPGDGSGIAAAVAAALIEPGIVFVRRGTYSLGVGRLSIPAFIDVRGEGPGVTIIVSDPTDNCAVQIASNGELHHMSLVHSGTTAGVGIGLIETTGNGVTISDLTLDCTPATAGGTMVAALSLNFGAEVPPKMNDSISQVRILLPTGVGGVDPNLWFAGVRGVNGVDERVALLTEVDVTDGDVGFMTLGNWFELDACTSTMPAVMNIYCNGGQFFVSGRRCTFVIEGDGPSNICGAYLESSVFDMIGATFVLHVGAPIPAILLDAATLGAVSGCKIGPFFDPSIQNDAGTNIVIIGNQIQSAPGGVPIAIGAAALDTNVIGNVSRGSGGTLPTDAGTGSNIANNIWGL